MGGKTERRLARSHNIDDLRTAALRQLPFPIFDLLDGAAEGERTLDRNRSSFDRYLLMPRILHVWILAQFGHPRRACRISSHGPERSFATAGFTAIL